MLHAIIEVKDFNVLNDNKPFFDQPIKNQENAYEKFVEMSSNAGCTIGNFYHQNYCKLKPNKQHYLTKQCFNCWKAAKIYSKLFFRFINCNRIIKQRNIKKY